MTRVLRFVKVALMLGWRTLLLSALLFTMAPSWNGYGALILGVPVLGSALLVFVLGRTLLVFPLVKLIGRSNPCPTEEELDRLRESARTRAIELSTEQRLKNPIVRDPSSLFDRRHRDSPLPKADLDADQLAELRVAFAEIFAALFSTMEADRRRALHEREIEAGQNYIRLLDVRTQHRDRLYHDAAATTSRRIEARFGVAQEGWFSFRDEALASHRDERDRQRRSSARRPEDVRSAAERRAIFDAYRDFTRSRLSASTLPQQKRLDAYIAKALTGRGSVSWLRSDPLSDTGVTEVELQAEELVRVIETKRRSASIEQIGSLLSDFEIDRLDSMSDGWRFLRDLHEMQPMTPETAHILALDALAEQFRLVDSTAAEQIISRFKY